MKHKSVKKQAAGGESGGISRREFARRAAGAAVAAAGISSAPLTAFAGYRGSGSPAPQSPAPVEKLSPAGLAEAEAKTLYAFATYGARLSNAQKTDLRRLIKEGVEPLEELRKYALANGVQPATVLRLYPDPRAKTKVSAKPVKKGGN